MNHENQLPRINKRVRFTPAAIKHGLRPRPDATLIRLTYEGLYVVLIDGTKTEQTFSPNFWEIIEPNGQPTRATGE